MARENNQPFIKSAESDLASVRSGLLIAAQTADASDLATPRRTLARLMGEASVNGLKEVSDLTENAIAALENVKAGPDTASRIYSTLDTIALIEAAVWKIPLDSENFLDDVSGFVDASFNVLVQEKDVSNDAWAAEEFEIDEETLEVFRSEADELLANIGRNLESLARTPGDQNALWEIRRNAHTFKGAAGIVGLTDASNIAHRIEDLLDRLVELRINPSAGVITFLDKSSARLNDIVAEKIPDEKDLEADYSTAMASLEAAEKHPAIPSLKQGSPAKPNSRRAEKNKPATAPIVRVSLDRLDEILKLSRSLLVNHSELVERFAELGLDLAVDIDTLSRLESIFEDQQGLTDDLHAKLLKIRMVRFGTLETRLSRAVHVTCLDEEKKANVEVENPDVEIDTQVIDSLIEPLLHLLKNSVVHGIERPDTRRLIGKPEMGTVRISIEADEEALILSVADDGSGVSIPKLKEKAIASGLIDEQTAEALSDRDALRLIFDRGLTTAEKVDLNAGRGVGMSIVKESIEARGGSVLVDSEPQRGTTFTIILPLSAASPNREAKAEPEQGDKLAPLVMIVDDSASIRRQTVKMIENAGLRSISANNGAEALELLLSGEWEPDLILSDVEMPQIDGWELLEYVKTDDNFGHVPVIMATSLDAEEHRDRAIKLGASDYVVKPFTEPDLERILEALNLTAQV